MRSKFNLEGKADRINKDGPIQESNLYDTDCMAVFVCLFIISNCCIHGYMEHSWTRSLKRKLVLMYAIVIHF